VRQGSAGSSTTSCSHAAGSLKTKSNTFQRGSVARHNTTGPSFNGTLSSRAKRRYHGCPNRSSKTLHFFDLCIAIRTNLNLTHRRTRSSEYLPIRSAGLAHSIVAAISLSSSLSLLSSLNGNRVVEFVMGKKIVIQNSPSRFPTI
jgi:hypothetical protein